MKKEYRCNWYKRGQVVCTSIYYERSLEDAVKKAERYMKNMPSKYDGFKFEEK